jgi:hypothetical protein
VREWAPEPESGPVSQKGPVLAQALELVWELVLGPVSGPVLEPESAMGIQTVLVWAQESAMGMG